ncbi:MAG: hypothetical protein KAS02_02760 [Candidatus Pacebacteria bacterium]|nr:hypothetical protein [Candidatus Paceibacterota bacterium]
MNIFLIGVYILLVFLIGWWVGRKETDNDFIIASRQVGVLRTTSSMFAVLGGLVLAGQATLAFVIGAGAMWLWIGLALGMIILGTFSAKVKYINDKDDLVTMGGYFKSRWGKNSGLISSSIIFVGFFSLLTAQFIIAGNILGPYLNISYISTILIIGLVVLGYLFLGGYRAVISTDIFQSILMILILMIVVIVVPFDNFSLASLNFFSLDIVSIFIFMIIGIATVLASADLWQRIFSAKNSRVAKQSSYFTAILFFLFGLAITFVGLAAFNSFPNANPDSALYLGIFSLVPEAFLGISIILVLSAIMSTIDTESFLLSSVVVKDFIPEKFVNKWGIRNTMRGSFFVLILLAILLAIFVNNILIILFGIISLIMSLSSVIFGSLFWKLKSNAVNISMLGGVMTLLVLFVIGKFNTDTAVLTLPVSLVLLIGGQIFLKNKKINTIS